MDYTVYFDKVFKLLENLLDIFGPEIFYVGAAFFLLHCLFGFQLLRVWSTIVGSVLGGAVAAYFGINAGWTVPNTIIFASIGAAAMGWAFYQIYLLGIFAICAGGTYAFMHFFITDSSMLMQVVLSLGIGVVAVICVRPLFIAFTAAIGGVMASLLFCVTKGISDIKTILLYGAAAAAVGVVCQLFFTAPLKEELEEPEDEEVPAVPVINLPEVEPIDELQPRKIAHDEGLPSSDELDEMIFEQLRNAALEEKQPNDFAEGDEPEAIEVIDDINEAEELPTAEAFAEGAEELPPENEAEEAEIDILIAEEMPEAEEYLTKEPEDAVAESGFAVGAQNDFVLEERTELDEPSSEEARQADIEAQLALENSIRKKEHEIHVKAAARQISSSLEDLQAKLLSDSEASADSSENDGSKQNE